MCCTECGIPPHPVSTAPGAHLTWAPAEGCWDQPFPRWEHGGCEGSLELTTLLMAPRGGNWWWNFFLSIRDVYRVYKVQDRDIIITTTNNNNVLQEQSKS